jgi:hypothetical protein
MHQNELQADAYRGFIPTIDKSEINRLADILAEKNFINPYDDFIVNLEIGQGKKELIDTFLKGISREMDKMSPEKGCALNKKISEL